MFKKLSKLPSIVYVILIPIGIAVLIVGIILIFTLIATVEGAASLLFLVIGFIFTLVGGSDIKISQVKATTSSISVAIGIVFFALMGMAIDQTGNIIYNYPIQVLFCPANTTLSREAIVTNPLPGRTDINQDYNCVKSNAVVTSVDIGNVLLVRFIEYVILGYIFIGLGKLVNMIKRNWAVADNQTV